MLDAAKRFGSKLIAYARYYYERYPSRVHTAAAAAVVFAATRLGIVVDEQSLDKALAYALPILLAGQAIHRKVEPVAGVRKPRRRKS
jgi:hypothetical protein